MLDMNVICECPVCGAVRQVMVNSDDYFAWQFEGKHAQDAFPYLSAVEREAIISGVCPTCWEMMFPPEEDEEEDIQALLEAGVHIINDVPMTPPAVM